MQDARMYVFYLKYIIEWVFHEWTGSCDMDIYIEETVPALS